MSLLQWTFLIFVILSVTMHAMILAMALTKLRLERKGMDYEKQIFDLLLSRSKQLKEQEDEILEMVTATRTFMTEEVEKSRRDMEIILDYIQKNPKGVSNS